LEKTKNNLRGTEGERVIDDILKISKSDMDKMISNSGLSEDNINKDLFTTVFNVFADYQGYTESGDDHSIESEQALVENLKNARDQYIGGILDKSMILRDTKDDRSHYSPTWRKGNMTVSDLAEASEALYANPHLVTKSAYGDGAFIPEAYNKTIPDVLAAQRKQLDDLGLNVKVNDREAVGEAGGKEYRINGKYGILHLEQKEKDGWKTVAVYQEGISGDSRKESGLERNAWVEADAEGHPKTQEITKKSLLFGGDKYIYKLFPWKPGQ
jgi:hypothetical protein